MLIENEEGWFDAILRSDYAVVQHSLARYKGTKTPSGLTGLMYSAMRNDYRMVHILKQHEAGCCDNRGYTALMLAAEADNPEVCLCLLDFEGHILLKDIYTAYNVAQWSRSYRAMKAMAQYYSKELPMESSIDSEDSGELLFRVETVASVQEYNAEQVKKMVNELSEAYVQLDSLQSLVVRQRDDLKAVLNANTVLRDVFIRQNNEMKQLESLIYGTLQEYPAASLICSQREELERLRLQVASLTIGAHILDHKIITSSGEQIVKPEPLQNNQTPELASLMKENARLRLSLSETQSQIGHILLKHDPLLITSDEAAKVTLEAEISLLNQELELRNGTISILTKTITDLKAEIQIECKSASTSMTIVSDSTDLNTEQVPKELILTDENGNVQQVLTQEDDAISLLFSQLEEKEKTITDLTARLSEHESLLEHQVEQLNAVTHEHADLIQSLRALVQSANTYDTNLPDVIPSILQSLALLLKEESLSLSPIEPSRQITRNASPYEHTGIPSVIHNHATLHVVSESPKINIATSTDLSSILEDSQSTNSLLSPNGGLSGISMNTLKSMQENDCLGLDLNAPNLISSPSIVIDKNSSIYRFLEKSPVTEAFPVDETISQLKDKVAEQEKLIDDQRLKIRDLEELNQVTNTSGTSKMIASLSLQLEEVKLSKLSVEDELRKSKEQLTELEKRREEELQRIPDCAVTDKIIDVSNNTDIKSVILELQQMRDENDELSKLVHILDAKLAEYEAAASACSMNGLADLEKRLEEKMLEVENLQEMVPLLKAKDVQIIQLTEQIALNTQAEHELLLANDMIVQLSEKLKQISNQSCQLIDQSIMTQSLILSRSISRSSGSDNTYGQTTHIIRDHLDIEESANVLTLTQTDKYPMMSDSDTIQLSSVLIHLDTSRSANPEPYVSGLQLESQSVSTSKGVNSLSQETDAKEHALTSNTSARLVYLEELCDSLKNQNDNLQSKLSTAIEQIESRVLTSANSIAEEMPQQHIHKLQLEVQEKDARIQQLQSEVQRARDASDSVIKNRQELQMRNDELQDELLDVSAQLVELRRTVLQRQNAISTETQTVANLENHTIMQFNEMAVQTVTYQSTSTKLHASMNSEGQPTHDVIKQQVENLNDINEYDADPGIVNIIIPRSSSQASTVKKSDLNISLHDCYSDLSPADSIVTLSGIQYAELLQSICGGSEEDLALDFGNISTDVRNSAINHLSLSRTLSNSIQKYTETDRITIPSSLVQTVQHLSIQMASIQSKLHQTELLNRSLRHELLETEATRDMIDNAEKELSVHQNEIRYLREELTSKENQIATITALLKKAENQLQERIALTEQDNIISDRKNAELLDLRQQKDALRGRNHEISIELESAKRQLELETSRGLQLEKELSSITSELQVARREQLELRTSASQLANENLALTALIAQTQTDTANESDITLSSTVELLESEKQELQNKLNRTVHSFINLKSHMDETTTALNRQVHDMEQQLVSTRNHLSEYKESYEQLSKEHDGALQRLDALSQTNKKLRILMADRKLNGYLELSSGITSSINTASSHKTEAEDTYGDTLLKEHHDDTPLMRAVLSNAPIGVLRRQLRHVGCVRPDGTTALMLASQMGNKNAVSVLREYESGVERADGATALDLAIKAERIEIIRLLLPFEKTR
ncbi:Hypothetical protein GLP15_590 [Giardia lamblia P15]|uniref:Ankyrin repeat protein n=1 Tax=Giardia intestinalis (strain P15) TaxID=658858 RepID=E1F559_GIAIA|nr:Hypothetical protein GLP15_590 [Giardia lamblia P15]